jgi:hypothetical protein
MDKFVLFLNNLSVILTIITGIYLVFLIFSYVFIISEEFKTKRFIITLTIFSITVAYNSI